jgi:isoleucyl-tRNA synthetase
MAEYKDTLNLPKTSFPMKANLPVREAEILRAWEEMDLYRKLRAVGGARPRFVLHDGPPYANGEIHIGHAVNKVLKDIIVKSRTLSGYDAPYVPGWDCHGLPIELMVEKKVGKAGAVIEPAAFRKACRAYAAGQVESQRRDFQRLGVIGDWAGPYLTMEHRFEAQIIRALGRIIANGHVHAGSKPVHWCSDCGSALAEAEVEYDERSSPAIDVRFGVLDEDDFLSRCHHAPEHSGSGTVSVVIWTTTPWTLPANQAVALNADVEYAVAQYEGPSGSERLVLAEVLLKDAMSRYGIDAYRVVAYCPGSALEGAKLRHPFYERVVPIILGEHVTLEAGTGAVHTAPGHGQEDYVVGSRYGIPVDNPVGPDGRFLDSTPLFGGMYVFSANARVVETLEERGTLLHSESIRHSYPHCWRHKTPIIFRATSQWFIGMEQEGLREQALRAIREVRWMPDWGEARIEGMVRNRPDWCISRQRNWGVPIVLFVHKETGAMHPRTAELLDAVARQVEVAGINAWYELDPADLLGDEARYYEKVHDILDVWFDSGVTHFCVLATHPDLSRPADLYLEGSDQHRGWFQSSLLTSCAMGEGAPYRGVLTHGFTVDALGRKMSKSRGNVIAPQEVVNKLGADVLRLWVAATDYRGEMGVSDEILKRTADAYRRLRNTVRFLLGNLDGFDPARHCVEPHKMLALDRWVVDRAHRLQAQILDAYESYQFHQIYQRMHNFCVVDLGAFYLDIIKDRLYTNCADGVPRRSAQTAMYHIGEALVRWLAPITSFTAEEAWQRLPGSRSESVFLETWYPGLFPLTSDDSFTRPDWERIVAVRDAVSNELERLRVAGGIGAGLDAEVDLYCDRDLHALLSRLGDELRFVLITSYARIHPQEKRPRKAVAGAVARLWVEVSPSDWPKCVRCWHRREDVGAHPSHPHLCTRCVENVEGAGETRRYA